MAKALLGASREVAQKLIVQREDQASLMCGKGSAVGFGQQVTEGAAVIVYDVLVTAKLGQRGAKRQCQFQLSDLVRVGCHVPSRGRTGQGNEAGEHGQDQTMGQDAVHGALVSRTPMTRQEVAPARAKLPQSLGRLALGVGLLYRSRRFGPGLAR